MKANRSDNILLNLINNLYLTQHVTKATKQNNILDHVLPSQPNLVENVKVEEPFSDHNAILFDVMLEVKKSK